MRCGVASRCITPDRPLRLSGYASRDKLSDGVYQDLFVKALALESVGGPVVIVTSDLLYFDDDVLAPVEAELARAPGLAPAQVFFTASHTHCGPVIRRRDAWTYGGRDERYMGELRDALVGVVRDALGSLEPARLTYRRTTCDFNINRRAKTPDGVLMLPNPEGVLDREVDVFAVTRQDGTVRAVLFGYACHPTTMGGYLIGGDYPGFAQRAIESAYPGASALFVQGCTGDVRPNNVDENGRFRSGPLEVVERFGRGLGERVLGALGDAGIHVDGAIQSSDRVVGIPLMPHPSRAELARALEDPSPFRKRWAADILDKYTRNASLPTSWPVHVQTLRIGETLSLVAIAGEVCAEIGIRIKELIGPGPRFVLGYTNRVAGYIPSASIHPEGGYEVDGWYLYEGMPSHFAASAEDLLVGAARGMLAP